MTHFEKMFTNINYFLDQINKSLFDKSYGKAIHSRLLHTKVVSLKKNSCSSSGNFFKARSCLNWCMAKLSRLVQGATKLTNAATGTENKLQNIHNSNFGRENFCIFLWLKFMLMLSRSFIWERFFIKTTSRVKFISLQKVQRVVLNGDIGRDKH